MVVFCCLIISRASLVFSSLREAYSGRLLYEDHVGQFVPGLFVGSQNILGSVEWTHLGQKATQT